MEADERVWTLSCAQHESGREGWQAGWWFDANGPRISEGESVRVMPCDEAERQARAVRFQVLTEIAEWCQAQAKQDNALADEHAKRREAQPHLAEAHRRNQAMHSDHANAFREAANYCREIAEESGAND